MRQLHEGQLVTVSEGDTKLDGIVFQVQGFLKAVVAVPDGEHAAFRTVHRSALSERTQAGEHDEVLHKLIRRTPSGARSGAGGSGPAGRGSRGHTRGADHRSTG